MKTRNATAIIVVLLTVGFAGLLSAQQTGGRGSSTLREPQGRPELGRGATGSGSSGAKSRDDGARRGVFDFVSFDPMPVNASPAGASAWGVQDLVGNGWEWTSTVFAGFPGFEPMVSYPEYSADFFDGQHYVMKGASPVTPRELVRRSFRNWFRPDYPYVFGKFRTVG
jgi:Sulfatase-modifying factor enzyme 1